MLVEIPTPTIPPKELLEDCRDLEYDIRTNEDLATAFNSRGDMLRLCSADKEALREWVREIERKQ